jgi:hypothetical protein
MGVSVAQTCLAADARNTDLHAVLLYAYTGCTAAWALLEWALVLLLRRPTARTVGWGIQGSDETAPLIPSRDSSLERLRHRITAGEYSASLFAKPALLADPLADPSLLSITQTCSRA